MSWKAVCLFTFLFLCTSLSAAGGQRRFLRYKCIEELPQYVVRDGHRRLPVLRTDWDSTRVYPVAVVLVSFADRAFSVGNPSEFYDRLFNEPGFNQGRGPGCVADYFRDQSAGLFKPRFDVYGPVYLSTRVNANGNYGGNAFRKATSLLADSLGLDMSPYDWDNDGRAEHLIFLYAGYGGNESATEGQGYIWPNTGSFATLTVGNVALSGYSASAELWSDDQSCGIGTICHEFSHTLGLPDFYPTSGSEYSVLDEWDLMDGGNFSDGGWCPCNYSIHEKMLLGWAAPTLLTGPSVVEGLLPMSQGGAAFQIVNDQASGSLNEYYLLENRQWHGWDMCLPGHGLLISHIDYQASAWSGNRVNSVPSHHRNDLMHADGHDFNYYDKLYTSSELYGADGRNRRLQYSPYPYAGNDQLTDDSTPAATVFGQNSDGNQLMSKPITDISESTDGVVSFIFMEGRSAISDTRCPGSDSGNSEIYDMTGRRISLETLRAMQKAACTRSGYGLYLIRDSRGNIRKLPLTSLGQ